MFFDLHGWWASVASNIRAAISVVIPRFPRREWIAEIMEHINEFYGAGNLPLEINAAPEKQAGGY
jgi:hypothetical protein